MEELELETIIRITSHQRRCTECGKDSSLEIHHRIFRSTKNSAMLKLLSDNKEVYERTYKKTLELRGMHDRQNLVRLCSGCHWKIHNGNKTLKDKYRNSFTCPITWYNVTYEKIDSLY